MWQSVWHRRLWRRLYPRAFEPPRMGSLLAERGGVVGMQWSSTTTLPPMRRQLNQRKASMASNETRMSAWPLSMIGEYNLAAETAPGSSPPSPRCDMPVDFGHFDVIARRQESRGQNFADQNRSLPTNAGEQDAFHFMHAATS